MTDIERIEQRLAAVERAVVDGDYELNDLADVAAIAEDVERLESRIDELERRVAEIEGKSEAFGGFVANVQSVNEDVEQQADAAIAAVDRLERRVEELEQTVDEGGTGRQSSASPESPRLTGDTMGDRFPADAPGPSAANPAAETGESAERPADEDRSPVSTPDLFENPSDAERAVDEIFSDDERPADREQTADGDGGLDAPTGGGDGGGRAREVTAADQQSVEASLSESDDADGNGNSESDDSSGMLTSLFSKLR